MYKGGYSMVAVVVVTNADVEGQAEACPDGRLLDEVLLYNGFCCCVIIAGIFKADGATGDAAVAATGNDEEGPEVEEAVEIELGTLNPLEDDIPSKPQRSKMGERLNTKMKGINKNRRRVGIGCLLL